MPAFHGYCPDSTILFGTACGLSMLCLSTSWIYELYSNSRLMSFFKLATVITQNKNIQIPTQSLGSLLPTLLMLYHRPYHYACSDDCLQHYPSNICLAEQYMCGGNRRAARLAASTRNVSSILYINNGALAALAGGLQRESHGIAHDRRQWRADATRRRCLRYRFGGAGKMSGCFIGILLLNVFNAGLQPSASRRTGKLLRAVGSRAVF